MYVIAFRRMIISKHIIKDQFFSNINIGIIEDDELNYFRSNYMFQIIRIYKLDKYDVPKLLLPNVSDCSGKPYKTR